MKKSDKSDFLIIGGGIIGVCVAHALKRKYPTAKILIIEKENKPGVHASGRNSGVLHAGFYYTANSLKAKFTKEGNQFLHSYCESRGILVNRCGKLIVARNEEDLSQIDELLKRAVANSVDLQEISINEAKKIEPRVKSYKRILWSPTTSSVHPLDVLQALIHDIQGLGVEYKTGVQYQKYIPERSSIKTSTGELSANYFINAAGLYADKVAFDFGYSKDFRIVPFKGLYIYAGSTFGKLNTNIYPVPDLSNPFLGVHYTITADGKAKIGPTAIPALWREQYQGFENFNLNEFISILFREVELLFNAGFEFRRLALEEVKKYSKKYMTKLAGELLEGVDANHFDKYGKAGIRAQLLNIQNKKLEMDFMFEGDKKSFHILNAVSPAFTSSMPFARHMVEQIEKLI